MQVLEVILPSLGIGSIDEMIQLFSITLVHARLLPIRQLLTLVDCICWIVAASPFCWIKMLSAIKWMNGILLAAKSRADAGEHRPRALLADGFSNGRDDLAHCPRVTTAILRTLAEDGTSP